MPQSLSSIQVHIVFSTKHRQPLLAEEIRDELHAYLGRIVARLQGSLLCAGSIEDHIHLLVAQPRTCAPANLVQELKSGSSKWLKTKSSLLRDFHWQNGYGMFSISPSHRVIVEGYIKNQKEHHRKVTVQDEYRRLLKKYGIKFDERYLWD